MGSLYNYNDQHELVADHLNRVECHMDVADTYANQGLDVCSSIREVQQRPATASTARGRQGHPDTYATETMLNYNDQRPSTARRSSSLNRPMQLRSMSQQSRGGDSIGTPMSTRGGAMTSRNVRFASGSAPDRRHSQCDMNDEDAVWNRLIRTQLHRDEELWRRQQVAEEFRIVNECIGCTFKPRTNHSNEPKPKNAMDAHARLYNDAVRKEKKRIETKKANEAKREKEMQQMQLAFKSRKQNEDIEVNNTCKFWERLYKKPEAQAPKPVTRPAPDPAKARKGAAAAMRLYKTASQSKLRRDELVERFEKEREAKLRNAMAAAGIHPIHNHVRREASPSPSRSPRATARPTTAVSLLASHPLPMNRHLANQQEHRQEFDSAQEEYTASLNRAMEDNSNDAEAPRETTAEPAEPAVNLRTRSATPPAVSPQNETSQSDEQSELELYEMPDDTTSNHNGSNSYQQAEEKSIVSKIDHENNRALNSGISASALIALSLSD